MLHLVKKSPDSDQQYRDVGIFAAQFLELHSHLTDAQALVALSAALRGFADYRREKIEAERNGAVT